MTAVQDATERAIAHMTAARAGTPRAVTAAETEQARAAGLAARTEQAAWAAVARVLVARGTRDGRS